MLALEPQDGEPLEQALLDLVCATIGGESQLRLAKDKSRKRSEDGDAPRPKWSSSSFLRARATKSFDSSSGVASVVVQGTDRSVSM